MKKQMVQVEQGCETYRKSIRTGEMLVSVLHDVWVARGGKGRFEAVF